VKNGEFTLFAGSMCNENCRSSLIIITMSQTSRGSEMPDGLTILLVFIALVIAYTAAKVIGYMRQSDRQWEEVDKSKLKDWEDDEDD
jgi:hypothetical protein